MSDNPYGRSTEHLTAKLPKLTRAQALQQIRGPAVGLITVSGLALGLAAVFLLYSVVQFGLKFLEADETPSVYVEPNPRESKKDREARKLREAKRESEARFVSFSTIFIASMSLVLINAVVLSGAIKMRNLQARRSATAAAAVAVIPVLSPLLVVGIPFGIWAMIKLGNPEIRRYFLS